MKTLLGGLALALIPAAVFAFDLPWNSAPTPAAPPPRPVVTEIVSDLPAEARAIPGMIVAHTEVTLGFQTLGRIVARDVEIGDRVQRGQLLAAQDPEYLADEVRAAEAAVAATQVQLSTAEATANRTTELARRNVATTAQMEQAERALAAARAAADQANSELIRAQDAAGFAHLIAPFSGIISGVHASAGAVVSAGEPVVTLSSNSDNEAVIDLPETVISELDGDTRFEVRLENSARPGTRARIARIEPLSDAATRTKRVHLALEDGNRFRLGALVIATLDTSNRPRLSIPESAVLVTPAGQVVWCVLRNGDTATVQAQPITTSMLLAGRYLVESGLKPGDEIVTRGVQSLIEGQAVGRRVAP